MSVIVCVRNTAARTTTAVILCLRQCLYRVIDFNPRIHKPPA